MRTKLVCAMLVLGCLISPGVASADGPGEAVAEMLELAKEATSGEGEGAAAQTFAEGFDMRAFARRCMVDHWSALSPSQRDEFVEVFSSVLRRRLERLESKGSGREGFAYKVGRAVKDAGGATRVPASVTADGATVEFVYYLVNDGGDYRLVDYEVEGAMLSRQYRGQFNRIMRKRGYEGLMDRLRVKYAQISGNG